MEGAPESLHPPTPCNALEEDGSVNRQQALTKVGLGLSSFQDWEGLSSCLQDTKSLEPCYGNKTELLTVPAAQAALHGSNRPIVRSTLCSALEVSGRESLLLEILYRQQTVVSMGGCCQYLSESAAAGPSDFPGFCLTELQTKGILNSLQLINPRGTRVTLADHYHCFPVITGSTWCSLLYIFS